MFVGSALQTLGAPTVGASTLVMAGTLGRVCRRQWQHWRHQRGSRGQQSELRSSEEERAKQDDKLAVMVSRVTGETNTASNGSSDHQQPLPVGQLSGRDSEARLAGSTHLRSPASRRRHSSLGNLMMLATCSCALLLNAVAPPAGGSMSEMPDVDLSELPDESSAPEASEADLHRLTARVAVMYPLLRMVVGLLVAHTHMVLCHVTSHHFTCAACTR